MLARQISEKIINNKIFWALVILLGLCLLYLRLCSLTVKDAVLKNAGGQEEAIFLPFIRDMPETEYTIRGDVYFHWPFFVGTAYISPDDELRSLRINRQELAFNQLAARDTFAGMHLDLEPYLADGKNTIEFRLYNRGGPSGIVFENSRRDIKALAAGGLALFAILGLLYFILACFIQRRAIILILLGGFLLRVLYFNVTPFYTRSHDVEGHIPYIEHVLAHWTMPERNAGWETYQPPLYYFTAALIYKAGGLLGLHSIYDLYRLIQFFSLLLAMGFLCAAWAVFRQLGTRLPGFNPSPPLSPPLSAPLAAPPAVAPGDEAKRNRPLLLMLGLLTFWPSNVIHSIRIGNDGLFYFFYALGLLFLIKWYYTDTARNLFLSFIFITLCFITKANGLVLYGVFGIIYILKFVRDKHKSIKKYLLRSSLLLVICSAGLAITFGAAVVQKTKGSPEHFLVPNIGDGGVQKVGNGLKNYLWLDLPVYLTVPYIDPWSDEGGRQYFWNYLLKTGLMGEFHFDTPFHYFLMLVLSYLLLGIILFTLFGLVLVILREGRDHLILLLNLILLFIALVLFRFSLPASCSNDFRYILPGLISSCFFYGYGVWYCHRQGWKIAEITGYGLALVFLATGSLFLLGTQF